MLHLPWRQILILTAVLFFCTSSSYAQRRGNVYNYLEFKNKPYYFGISMGYAGSNYRLQHSEDFILNDEYRIVESVSGPGMRIGVIGNLKFGEFFDFRLIPGFAFTERYIEYQDYNPDGASGLQSEKIDATFFELPFLIRYKSEPYKDMRFFLIGGAKYSYDISNTSRTRQAETLIKVAPHDFSAEFGVGVQFFFPYFIFSPQIKVSHGMGNLLLYNGNLEKSNVIEKINSRMISISFNFEG
jgi:hypothetical protein